MVREYRFAGVFYSKNKVMLADAAKSLIANAIVDPAIKSGYAYVSPHAGYAYSGSTAACTYKALSQNKDLGRIDTIIIVGPNHTGDGENISVSAQDWETPLGVLKNNTPLSRQIASKGIKVDESAHLEEHSIEVQLPFLNVIAPTKKFCFICMRDQSVESSAKLSDSIIAASRKLNSNAVVIASSDFDHYEPRREAARKDGLLIKALSGLDYEGFDRLASELNDSACGVGPVMTALLFAKSMGATKSLLLRYSDSSSVTKDYSSVVAYASIVFI
ncbi:MAG: AmmeMemoRadiSam system protein B [Candidatus Marsarchaeota archaeon]|nr:AmmeMemoRadiSam system protein B [Candidatus Marsarchaeota archaeon]